MILTLTCKDIIKEDLNEFKEQINAYNFMSTIENDTLKFIQTFLFTKYGLSQVRYETAENFLNALSLRIYNTAPVFEKKLKVIKDALNLANENYYKSLKGYKDVYDIDTTLNQTDIRKDAETPTGIKPATDFVDKYTNAMAKTTASGSTTDDRTITHNEDSTADLIAKIDELEKLQSLLIEQYTNKFNDLFIQFL